MRLLLVVTAACSSSSVPSIGNKTPSTKPDARAYELGKGVARDYRVAAKLYRERCADGCGDLAACHAYLDMALEARGALATQADVPVIVRTCQRGERVACLYAALGELMESLPMEERHAVSEKCDDGDIKACQAELETDLG